MPDREARAKLYSGGVAGKHIIEGIPVLHSWLHVEQQRVDTNINQALETQHHDVVARWAPTLLLVPNQNQPAPLHVANPDAPLHGANPNAPRHGAPNQPNPVDVLAAAALRNFARTNPDAAEDDDGSEITSGSCYEPYQQQRIFQAAGFPRPFVGLTDDQLM